MEWMFNPDNPVLQALGRIVDIIILSVLWFVCSIPIITIGASTTALYYVTLKMAEKKEGYLVKGFLKSFKENFRQATFIWLPMAVILFLIIIDINFFRQIDTAIGKVALILVFALLFFLLIINLYVYPVLSRFSNTIKQTLINTFFIAFGNPLYMLWSVGIVVITAVIVYYMPLIVVIVPGALSYALAFPMSRIIAKYMPPSDGDSEK